MAPMTPLGREQVMQLVAEGPLPFSFGSPHLSVMAVEQDGMFRIRELVVDKHAAELAAASTHRSRSPSWMPEHYYSMGQPTGTIFAEGASRAELREAIRTMTWPENW